MFRASFDVNGVTTIVSLNTIDPEEYAEMQLSGDPQSIEAFREWISNQSGPFGHDLEPDVSNITDLHYLVMSQRGTDVNPKILEGMELVKTYPSPPEGAIF